MSNTSTADLVAAWRCSGSEDAARALVDRTRSVVMGAVARAIPRRLAGKVEPADITQSAYRIFFRRVTEGSFEVRHSVDLLGLLLTVARNRLGNATAHFRREKRDIHRERNLDDVAEAARDNQPAPDEALMLKEAEQQLLKSLPERHREVLRGLQEGLSPAEIADGTGYSYARVLQILKGIKDRVQTLLEIQPRSD